MKSRSRSVTTSAPAGTTVGVNQGSSLSAPKAMVMPWRSMQVRKAVVDSGELMRPKAAAVSSWKQTVCAAGLTCPARKSSAPSGQVPMVGGTL